MSGNLAAINGGAAMDTTDWEQEDEFAKMVPGWYQVEIEEADLKETKKSEESGAGNAYYVSLKLRVVEGPFKKRVIWDNVNIVNPNETAQRIGRSRMASIGQAIGVPKPSDTSELVGKVMDVKVAVRKDDPDNVEVKAVAQYGTHEPNKATSVASSPSSPTSGASKRPWEK